jgi:hypothetical protein
MAQQHCGYGWNPALFPIGYWFEYIYLMAIGQGNVTGRRKKEVGKGGY